MALLGTTHWILWVGSIEKEFFLLPGGVSIIVIIKIIIIIIIIILHQSEKESLQKPEDLQSTHHKSILAGLSLWPCSISLHILCNAFVVHSDDIVLN